jgi:hypothetical protein
MNDVERLLAYEEIRQLASRYALCMDTRDLDRLVQLYVPEVRVSRELSGRQALREDFDRSLRAVGLSILNVGTQVIELEDDDHAHGFVYCHAQVVQQGRWIVQAVQYQDRYERSDGHWLFARRKHLLFYGAEFGRNPIDLPPSGWPEFGTGKGSVPESFESWQRFWAPR